MANLTIFRYPDPAVHTHIATSFFLYRKHHINGFHIGAQRPARGCWIRQTAELLAQVPE